MTQPTPPSVCGHLHQDQLHQLLSCLCPTRVQPPSQCISLLRAQAGQVQLACSCLPHHQPGLCLQLHHLPPNCLSLTSRQARHLGLTQAGQHRQAASSGGLSAPGSDGLVQSLHGHNHQTHGRSSQGLSVSPQTSRLLALGPLCKLCAEAANAGHIPVPATQHQPCVCTLLWLTVSSGLLLISCSSPATSCCTKLLADSWLTADTSAGAAAVMVAASC